MLNEGTSSKVFLILSWVSADCAPQGILLSVLWVRHDFQWAPRPSFALGQLAFLFSGHIVSLHLPLMARLTEMSWAPTEPLSYGAAKSALELNEVGSMLLAVGNSSLNVDCSALSTDKLLRLVILTVLLRLFAVLHTSEVWAFAFEAHVVREFVYWEASQVIVEFVIRVFESRVFL